jgi:hypothetical protein
MGFRSCGSALASSGFGSEAIVDTQQVLPEADSTPHSRLDERDRLWLIGGAINT